MSKPFDAATKHLFETDPGTWLRYAGIEPDGPVRVIDTDLSTVTATADAVVRVDGPEPWLVHFEFQSSPDAELARRLMRYNVLLDSRHGLPVLTVLVLLRPEADRPALTGATEVRLPNGRLCHQFHYLVVRAWEKPLNDVLAGGLATLPLAALAELPAGSLPAVVDRIRTRLSQEVSPKEAAVLWTAFFVLIGMKYPSEITDPLIQGVRAMVDLRESSTYQLILAEGKAEGLAEGKAEGLAEGKAEGLAEGKAEGLAEGLAEGKAEGESEGRTKAGIELLLQSGRRLFGEPDRPTLQQIESIGDWQRIRQLHFRVFEVSSWAELLSTDPPA